MHSLRSPAATVGLAIAAFSAGLQAQGAFVNYEDPQIKPVAVAAVGAYDYVLACNTPDNSVEVYRADWNLGAPIARVGVGLSPVTVKWDPATGHLYTCNYLGDSVSRVRLDLVPATSTTPETVRPVLERTEHVGDEPTDIAFDPSATTAVVTLHASGSVKRIQKADLSAVTGPLPMGVLMPTAPQANLGPFVDPQNPRLPVWVLKQARRIEILRDSRAYVLNTMGGELSGRSIYDLGLIAIDPSGVMHGVRGTGSTNFGMAVNATQDRMFVVSQIAKNDGNQGIGAVNQELTGFVQTWLQVLTLPAAGTAPTLHGGPGTNPLPSIDLNFDYGAPARAAQPRNSRIAQVTDITLIPDPVAGNPERIVLAGFGSDLVMILTPASGNPNGYTRTIVNIPALTGGGYGAVGPRGLAFAARASQPASGTSGLVYVLNRLDNSLAVVNPYNGAVTRRALGNDPTPANIRAGRRFLYNATATSGGMQGGMVSCASCHVDARTDALRWRLGDLHAGGTIAAHLVDGMDPSLVPIDPVTGQSQFPTDKPEIVTQTLQGLVNYHLEPDHLQFLATNAPYHWRGDKAAFTDFNEAFVNLQGMPPQPSSPGIADPRGLTPGDMETYASFINTIHHPPNPQQPQDRTVGGTLGNPDLFNDTPAASGAQWGMKLYHAMAAVEGRSCVNCHSLPEGSSNTLTITATVPGVLSSTGSSPTQEHPFETAALRNVVAREVLAPDQYRITGLSPFWPIQGSSGLHHGGAASVPGTNSWSLNDNVHRTFGVIMPLTPGQAEAMTEFLRQLDTGTAPLIGFAWTMQAGAALGDPRFVLASKQSQQANVGVAVYLRANGIERGFWYDATANLYREVNGGLTMTENALVQSLQQPDDVLIVQATPTGSERRVASLTGTAAPLGTASPANLRLLPMVPDTAFVGITALEGNLDPNRPLLPFAWSPVTPKPTPISQASQRTLAQVLGTAPPLGAYGVPQQLRHEPPRRFRVTGTNIRNGAKLGIEAISAPGVVVWFDLAATGFTTTDPVLGTLPVWETAEELDAHQTLAMLCGGHAAPGVLNVLLGDLTAAAALNPQAFNRYLVHVRNDDGSLGTSPPNQVLSIADQR